MIPHLRPETARRALLALPLLAMAFAVAAFGGVYAWAFGLAYTFIFASLAAFALAAWRADTRLHWCPIYGPLLAFALFAAWQCGSGSSQVPASTASAALHLAAAGAVFVLFTQLYRGDRDAGWIAAAINGFTAALALLAILQVLTGADGIYWRFTYLYASPAGSFVNRNHFAGCMELLLPVSCVAAFQHRHRPLSRFLAWATAPALGIAAVLLSASRGGMAALAVEAVSGLIIWLFLERLRRRIAVEQTGDPEAPPSTRPVDMAAVASASPRYLSAPSPQRRAALLAAIGLAAAMVWIVGTSRLQARLHRGSGLTVEPSLAQRAFLNQSTWDMFIQRPWSGWGLGTWANLYPEFARFDDNAVYTFAHNDILQGLAETGLIGVLCALAFWTFWLRGFYQTLRRWPPAHIHLGGGAPPAFSLAVGSAIACAGLIVHSWVDFNLHIPANLLLFFAISALALPASASLAPDRTAASVTAGRPR